MLERNITDPTEFMQPKYPIKMGKGKEEKTVKKMDMKDDGRMAFVYVTKEDLVGTYDYKVDIETMNVNSSEQRKQAKQTALSLLVTNPNVSALLQQENTKPKFKDIFITWLDDLGWEDADKYFATVEPATAPPPAGTPQGTPAQAQTPPTQPAAPAAAPGASAQQPAGGAPALVEPFGYYNYAPANDLQGVPAYVANKYRQGPLAGPANQ
jgi:hypothetical protein